MPTNEYLGFDEAGNPTGAVMATEATAEERGLLREDEFFASERLKKWRQEQAKQLDTAAADSTSSPTKNPESKKT
jgi:hypothetical protein